MKINLARMFWLQMRWIAIVLLFLGCCLFQVKAAITPSVLSPDELEKLINKHPEYKGLYCSELGDFKGKLYAASNIGLLEIDNGVLSKVYKWKNSTEGGPWIDKANGQLWVWLADDRLATFDGHVWRATPMPTPKKGYFTRGEILEGFHEVSTPDSFWLTGAGCAWCWNIERRKWEEKLSLPTFEESNRLGKRLGGLWRLFFLDNKPFIVVRYAYGWEIIGRERLKTRVHGDRIATNLISDKVYYYDNRWIEVSNAAATPIYVEQAVSVGKRAFMRSDEGEVYQVDSSGIVKLMLPGKCEALTATSSGTLLASFCDLGVYELAQDWTLRFKFPKLQTNVANHVGLAEESGKIAVVRDNFLNSRDSDFWIFDGTEPKKFNFPGDAQTK